MPDFEQEHACRLAGYDVVCGIDEAGRGPWAGPVVAAAAIIVNPDVRSELLDQLDDSKKLRGRKRELLFSQFDNQIEFGTGIASVDEIDRLNILAATLLAMRRAVLALPREVDFALVDGNRKPDLGSVESRCIVGGDGQCLSIAAASIAAKVTRDRIMRELADQFPGYGWERNAGYGTPEHHATMMRLGITSAHRKSFAPVRKILGR